MGLCSNTNRTKELFELRPSISLVGDDLIVFRNTKQTFVHLVVHANDLEDRFLAVEFADYIGELAAPFRIPYTYRY